MIVWRDLFKPRYAVVFVPVTMPSIQIEDGNLKFGTKTVACVIDRPYKRPLHVPFNQFVNELFRKGTVVAGHYWVLRALHGIGSTNATNMANPIIFGEKE